MAKRSAGEGGNGGNIVLGPKSTFVWGVVAGIVLSVVVCKAWCWKKCCYGHGGMAACHYGEKMAPAPEGKTNSK